MDDGKCILAKLTIVGESKVIDSLYRSLFPETHSMPREERVRVLINKQQADGLVIEFKAKDVSALRAAINSFLYMIHSCISTIMNIETQLRRRT